MKAVRAYIATREGQRKRISGSYGTWRRACGFHLYTSVCEIRPTSEPAQQRSTLPDCCGRLLEGSVCEIRISIPIEKE